jgi:hypothetical protein
MMALQDSTDVGARLVFETRVSVLFARSDSVYKSLPGVDVWDAERDALTWPGGTPVVAHPPCRAWGVLRRMANPRRHERMLATFALRQVRRWGGVLEHPAGSRLWPRCGLPAPGKGADKYGGWTLGVTQHWWGHPATKATKLYICGCDPQSIPELPPLRLGEGERVITNSKNLRRGRGDTRFRTECTKAQREHTPVEFARWLVDLASRCSSGR